MLIRSASANPFSRCFGSIFENCPNHAIVFLSRTMLLGPLQLSFFDTELLEGRPK